jgi:hypothetical protein
MAVKRKPIRRLTKRSRVQRPAPAPPPPVDPGNPDVVAGAVAGTTTTDSDSLTVPLGPATRSNTAGNEQDEDFVADVSDEAIHDPDDLFVDDDVCVVDTNFAKRMTIAYIYMLMFLKHPSSLQQVTIVTEKINGKVKVVFMRKSPRF